MYTLYGFAKTRSVRVAWALEELGLPYEYTFVNLRKGEHKSVDFLALNPAGKIPTLLTELGPMSESAGIVTWLMDKHGHHEFMPAIGSRARMRYEQAMAFVVAELEQPLWNKAKHDFALPDRYRLDGMETVATYEFGVALKTFAVLLGDESYLAGDLFSGVDIVAGHVLSWAKGSGMDLTYDNVKAYADRVLSRPAYEKAWRNEKAHVPASL